MNKVSKRPRVTTNKDALNPFLDLNKNIEALAAHLCAYANVLKQCDTRPAPGQSI
jgi:hypothetical protein